VAVCFLPCRNTGIKSFLQRVIKEKDDISLPGMTICPEEIIMIIQTYILPFV
jgi:hypothetical protein